MVKEKSAISSLCMISFTDVLPEYYPRTSFSNKYSGLNLLPLYSVLKSCLLLIPHDF